MYWRFGAYIVFWLFISAVLAAASPDDDSSFLRDNKRKLFGLLTNILLASAPAIFGLPDDDDDNNEQKPRSPSFPHRNRTRKSVVDIMDELGPHCVRRAHRMDQESFFSLLGMLEPYVNSPESNKKGAKNDLISLEIRLSAALRFFAGGRPEDISVVHGISHSEAFNSVWKVVDAVNAAKEMAFSYPSCHEKQRAIAAGFQARSSPHFGNCAGAIDGMLIWIEKPTEKQCAIATVGSKKWFCGRKKKFGIALQGTCDVNGKFLDVSMEHPASTSDFLAFSTSPLKDQLEQEGFLADGLCLFGDLAYVNCRYVCTPHRQSSAGSAEDNYSFYHSQVSHHLNLKFNSITIDPLTLSKATD